MSRSAEKDDAAAKAVASVSRLRQAPASDEPPRPPPSPASAPRQEASAAKKKKKIAKQAGVSQAPASFQEAEEEALAAGEETSKPPASKVLSNTSSTNIGMRAVAHREQRGRPPLVQGDSLSVVSASPDGGDMNPGAFQVGGRRGEDAADAFTVSLEEGLAPVSEGRSSEHLPVAALAAELVHEEDRAAPDRQRVVDEVPLATAQRPWFSRRRNRYIVLLISLLVVGIVVAVVVLFGIPGDENGGQGQGSAGLEEGSEDTLPPSTLCTNGGSSCVGDESCSGVTGLCAQAGSCVGPGACRASTNLTVSGGSCVGISACEEAAGFIDPSSCVADNSCSGFGGLSIGSNSCNCVECCSCYATGELPDMIPSDSCNVRGECCSTPSPTISPSKAPTSSPTMSPAPSMSSMSPSSNPTPQPSALPTWSSFDAAFAEMLAFAQTKSSSSSLSNPNSPQYQAVEWLARDKLDNRSNWSGYELLQRYVLRVLYHSTSGADWSTTASTSWFGASRVCRWTRYLDCNGNGQQVDRISLSFVKLQGTIPDELGLLTSLTQLLLYGNQLTGTIPTQLGHLTALEELNLRSNQLTGSIPSQLGQLTALTDLELYNNQLTGTIPSEFGLLTALKELDMVNFQLTGTIPAELGQLTALTFLGLRSNNLTGAIPTQLFQLTSLPSLDLRSNQLSGTIPTQLGLHPKLVMLDLSYNQLTGNIPTALTQLTGLRYLFFHKNNLTGQVPSAFCAAPFPDWRADGPHLNTLWADCMSEVQCDCCDFCVDDTDDIFCWNGSEYAAC